MLPMRQSYRIIPIYTADVSGVCSALYELGGMTVMHDPSGCNSTYNTHDEIRWYDQDSLIFISGLTEIDAIMGNDRKFIDDIKHAVRELHPKFLALAGSPIPFMNGTDFPAIARVIETETGIPAFSVPTNGMHDYIYGAGIALEQIARRFVKKPARQEKEAVFSRSVNLLGVTPLDFGPQENVETLKENLKKYDDELDSLIVCGSPSENKAAKAAGFLAKTACKMGAHKKGKFFQKMALGLYGKALGEDESENGWISYNKENVKAYDENPLDGFVFSNNGFLNLFLLMDATYNKKGWQVKHPSLPILFIAGADDPCIGSKKQYAQAMTTLKKRGYNQVRGMLFLNRRHEILNEDDVEKVYDAVLHFLEQHSKRDD